MIIIIILLGLYNTGCDKDPASSSNQIPDGLTISYPSDHAAGIVTIDVENLLENHEDDNHAIIAGFQLEQEGESIYSYRQLGLVVEGAITINVGETVEFAVHFLDCEDLMDEVSCTALDECEWHEDDSACEDADEGHDDEDHEDHGMMIEITGVSIGTTEFQIELMHDGHSDYTSLPISVTVVNPTNPE